MLLGIIISFIIIIFPIFIKFDSVFINDNKIIHINIYLLGFIKVFYLNIKLYSDYLVIKLLKNKIKKVKYFKLFKDKNKIKPLKDFHFIKIDYFIEYGRNNLVLNFTFNYFFYYIKWVLFNKKPYLKLNNYNKLSKNDHDFNIYLDVLLVFNLLMIILSFIKMLSEKILYEIKAKRKQNKQHG